MNWQLLIKIVSSSLLQPRSRGCSPFSGEIGGEELFRLANLTKQGRGGGRRGGWRFFEGRGQHSFCSCQLFITGDTSRDRRESCPPPLLPSSAREEMERPADLFLLLPWGFPNVGLDYPPTPSYLGCTGEEEDLSSRNNASSTLRGRF